MVASLGTLVIYLINYEICQRYSISIFIVKPQIGEEVRLCREVAKTNKQILL